MHALENCFEAFVSVLSIEHKILVLSQIESIKSVVGYLRTASYATQILEIWNRAMLLTPDILIQTQHAAITNV